MQQKAKQTTIFKKPKVIASFPNGVELFNNQNIATKSSQEHMEKQFDKQMSHRNYVMSTQNSIWH